LRRKIKKKTINSKTMKSSREYSMLKDL
jgi:hypothetical protein